MSDDRFTPDEFARLLTLPEGHPDRVAAEQSTAFVAMQHLLADFERPATEGTGDTVLESERRELGARLASAIRGPGPAGVVSGPRSSPRPSRFEALAAMFRAPVGRVGLALAAVALVAGIGWWSQFRTPGADAMRGEPETSSFVLEAVRPQADAVTLRWTPVAGAEGYRLVFRGADLRELARLDVASGVEATLRADALPARLAAGSQVLVEICALRRGDVIATSPARPIRLP
jgi:hypothetical protein